METFTNWLRQSAFLTILLCAGANACFAQTHRIETLKANLAESPNDSHRIDLLNELSWAFHRIDLTESLAYAKEAQSLAEKLNYRKGLARALNLEGIAYIFRNQTDKAIQLNRQALDIAEGIQDSFLIAVTHNDIGISIFNDYPTALKYLQEALAYCPRNELLIHIFFLGNIAELHLRLNNKTRAEAYIREAIDLTRDSRDTNIMITMAMIEAAYQNQTGNIARAKELYEKARALAVLVNDYYAQAEVELSMAGFLLEENKPEASLSRIELAEALMNKSGNNYFLAGCIYQKAEVYEKLMDYVNAEANVRKSLAIAGRNHDMATQFNCYRLLKEIYGKTYRPALALMVSDSLFALKDSLSNREKNQIFAQNEIAFQSAQKDAENRFLKKENEANLFKLKNNKLLLETSIIIIMLGLCVILAFWLNYKSKSQQGRVLEKTIREKTSDLKQLNEELKASNMELEHFARMASHDLKEPIRNIVSFAGLLQKKLDKDHPDPELKDHAGYIIQSTKHLYTLIEDVMTFTRLSQDQIEPKPVALMDVAEQAIEAISDLIDQKSAVIEIGALPVINGSETMMFQIFKNLIENGIKYNRNSPPTVWIRHTMENGMLHLEFRDNGIGIAPEFHSQIFEMFKRLHTRQEYEGSGIGLATCQKVIRLMEGKIHVNSFPGEGSVFVVSLPCQLAEKTYPDPIRINMQFQSSMLPVLKLKK